jgi:hypothetical protein
MTSYALGVTVEDKRKLAKYYEGIVDNKRQTLKALCEDYFDEQKDLQDGDEIDVKIKLSEPVVFRLGGLRLQRTQFDVYVSGIFAGQPFEHHRCIKEPMAFTTRSARKKKKKRLKKQLAAPDADDDLFHEQLFSNLSEKMFDGFEKAIGRSSSFVALRWKTAQSALAVVEFLFVAFMFWTFFLSGFLDQASAGFRRFFWFGCVITGMLLYMVGYVVCAALMPLEFFEDHREGHRVMDFVNTDDPRKARNALRVGVVVLAAIGVFMVIVYKTTFSR